MKLEFHLSIRFMVLQPGNESLGDNLCRSHIN